MVDALGVSMSAMAEREDTMIERDERLVDMAARMRRERDERIEKMRMKMAEEPRSFDPGLKELVDTQDEFRERVMGKIERIIASARF